MSRQSEPANIYAKLCHFVDQHAYLPDKDMRPWLQKCLLRSKLVNAETTPDAIIQDLNQQFSSLKTSHLVLYNAKDSQKIWSGESAETGIDAQYVEGELVIFRVHKNSPAEKAGLRMGDVLYRINNEDASPDVAEKASGSFMILRDKKIREYRIEAKDMLRDEEPQLTRMSNKTVVFKVPSFRAEFFEKEKWQA
ncbi:MAG: PDZ domain-containing protein, partial [Proteobacteria bacterium]